MTVYVHSLNRKLFRFFIALAIASMFINCNKGKGGETVFDRKAMLQNFADSLIKPAFSDLQVKVNILKSATDAFVAMPDADKLNSLQAAWDEAYSSWMFANAYNIGSAGEEGIRKGLVEEIGTWPVDTAIIENAIASNGTVSTGFNRNNRGLNAAAYLIFDLGQNNSAVVNLFAKSVNRRNYLQTLINKIQVQVAAVVVDWEQSYTASFIANDGTNVGSSVSQLYNEFLSSFESIKNFKLGVPLGLQAAQTGVEPTAVEARHSRKAVKYLKLHLQAIENIWYGKTKAGNDGVGWQEYIASVTGGKDLIARTEAQLEVIKAILKQIPDTASLGEQIVTNNTALTSLYAALQKHLINYKSDMSSLLGIAITFSSSDGD